MPCPHNEISIVQRSHRQSAVAAAAYQSGEKLFCEYDQEVKHYPEKRGIVHNEILLPANAPLEYTDRNTLWNAAEAVEKQWNSQLARRWVLSIPREIPPDQYAALVRDFCRQQFVSKGMCVDFAIHDKGDGNPHAHVMLTMRAMDERGKWLPKSRKVYELDKNGERIKLPSGRWKSHKEDTVDWNDRKYGEIWRHEWEVIQNRYLEANNRPERVDLRSYERQGLDIIPTVHEGAAVRQMEKRGIQTNIGNLNREIKAANSLMKSIRQLIKNLKGWIAELSEKRNELLAQKAAEEAVFLPNLLMKYMEIRKAERSSWTRAGQSRGTSKDLKAVSEALSYLQRKGLSTVEDLENFIETSGKSAADYRKQMKPKETRSNVIDAILAARTDCKECKPVYEKYQKIFFKKTKEKFKLEHPEVARFEKASAYLAKHPDDKDSTKKELLQEQAKLVDEIADLKVPLTEVQEDLKKLRDIRYWVRKATPGTEESKEPPKKQTPQGWNGSIFNMIENLSNSIMVPIAGVILAIVMTVDLIQMIADKNNLHDVDTWMIFKWVFKSAAAILIVTNTWNIVMGVFDMAQSVVAQAAGVINSDASIDISSVMTDLEPRLMEMDLGPLFGLWFQSLFIGITMWALYICIFIVIYGRMIEIYLVTSVAPVPMAAMMGKEWGGMGQNYLRSLLALGFQAFLIIVCVAIYAVLVQNIALEDDIIMAIWSCVGYTVLLCFTLFKTGSLAKSVFQAH